MFETVKPNQGVFRLKAQFEGFALTIGIALEGLTFSIEGSLVAARWLVCKSRVAEKGGLPIRLTKVKSVCEPFIIFIRGHYGS